MRKKIAALIVALTLFGTGLFAAAVPSPAQATSTQVTAHHDRNWHPVLHSDAAKTVLTWSASRGCCHTRYMNVKCHSDNAWHVLLDGETTTQRCGLGGWIERTWVDPDVYLIVQNLATGGQTAYPAGCNCSIGGGNYIGWLNHV